MPLNPPKGLSRTARAAHMLEQIRDDLPPSLASSLDALKAKKPSRLGVLLAWRRLSRTEGLTAAQRYVVRENFTNAMARVLKQAADGKLVPFKAMDFGVPGYRELADLFLTMLERVGYGSFKLSKLTDIRQLMIGELLEVLVRNSGMLQPELMKMAKAQLQLVLEADTTLLTARGRPFKAKAKFGPVARATDVWVKDSLGTRKFIDLLHVSTALREDGKLIVVILVETEIKMPVAARNAGQQVGRAQARFRLLNKGVLLANVEGLGAVEIPPERIVFAEKPIDRTLITLADSEQFRFRSTSRGGYDEVFLQVSLQMKAEFVRQLVALAIPGS